MLTRHLLDHERGGRMLLGTLAVAAVAVPAANLLVPEESVFHVPTYTVTLLGKYLCYAMLAISLDLVWGYCGILSLGHGAFFALGGYAMGMHLTRRIGDRGVYGHPELPDFMVFLNWDALPWYWLGFDRFWFAMLMVALAPGALAFVFGCLTFRSRVSGVYLAIMTQALTYALMLVFFRNETGFGGDNGLTGFKDLLGASLQADATRAGLFAASAAALALACLACRLVVRSRLGRVMTAIRDAEDRARFLGYRVERFKLAVFTASAVLAGVAGALYVPQVGIVNPSEFHPLSSIEVVVWVAVGGRGTLYGAALGAVAVSYAKTTLTAALPELWPFVLGALFILVTLALPRGMAGLWPGFRTAERGGRGPGRGPKPGAAGPVPDPDASRPAPAPAREARGMVAAPAHERERHGKPARRRRFDFRLGDRMREEPIDPASGCILLLEDLTVRFDGFKALDGLSMHVETGELLCIIGPNGAGKTTMMDVVTGRTRPDSGRALYARRFDLTRLSEPEIAAAGIGRKFQQPTVFENHTVFENLELAMSADKRVWPTLAARPGGEQRDRIESALHTVDLGDHAGDRAGALSHGRKQWLEIGMLLVQDPLVLLVDEPAAGMTHRESEMTAELLARLAGDHSIVVVEHDMDFVRSIARRVVVLHEGRVLAQGPFETVQEDARVREVYLGA